MQLKLTDQFPETSTCVPKRCVQREVALCWKRNNNPILILVEIDAQMQPGLESAWHQKATDRLTDLLADLIEHSLGFDANDEEDFHPMLLEVLKAAIELGRYLLRHPVGYRFDWVTGDPQSEKQVIVFPKVARATDDQGSPKLRPIVIDSGIVHKQE